jgi:hypothetical protein
VSEASSRRHDVCTDVYPEVIMKKLLATMVLGLGIAALLPTGCGLPAVQAATPSAVTVGAT